MRKLIVLAICLAAAAQSAVGRAGKAFHFSGSYFEGCSCNGVCQCELTGVEMGCQGVGFFKADNASYDGMDLSGVKTAYATVPGQWVLIYIDAPDSKREAATNFMKAALAPFGPNIGVTNAKITIDGSGGTMTGKVNDGTIMSLTTEPVLGLDQKNPLTYTNIKDPLHPTVMQGKTLNCSFSDGSHSFTLKGTNSFFNDHLDSQGDF